MNFGMCCTMELSVSDYPNKAAILAAYATHSLTSSGLCLNYKDLDKE